MVLFIYVVLTISWRISQQINNGRCPVISVTQAMIARQESCEQMVETFHGMEEKIASLLQGHAKTIEQLYKRIDQLDDAREQDKMLFQAKERAMQGEINALKTKIYGQECWIQQVSKKADQAFSSATNHTHSVSVYATPGMRTWQTTKPQT